MKHYLRRGYPATKDTSVSVGKTPRTRAQHQVRERTAGRHIRAHSHVQGRGRDRSSGGRGGVLSRAGRQCKCTGQSTCCCARNTGGFANNQRLVAADRAGSHKHWLGHFLQLFGGFAVLFPLVSGIVVANQPHISHVGVEQRRRGTAELVSLDEIFIAAGGGLEENTGEMVAGKQDLRILQRDKGIAERRTGGLVEAIVMLVEAIVVVAAVAVAVVGVPV